MLITTGLIGDPVGHSVSPAMQNAAFAACGLAEQYVLWQTPAPTLPQRVAQLRAPDMRGANVTVPHKTTVMALLDHVDHTAQAIGAVNTIVRRQNGQLHGMNTDAPGFARALQHGGYKALGSAAVVLGAGGAARAVVYALLHAGVRSLVVANRTPEHAATLVLDIHQHTAAHVQALALDNAALPDVITHADLLVNTTTAGLDGSSSPIDHACLHAGLFVVDAIYRPTPLLRAAAACGARVQDGLEMLVQQGALAWEAWTEHAAPVNVMRAAARHAVEKR